MAEQRSNQDRSFAERVGDRVIGRIDDSRSDRASGFRTDADIPQGEAATGREAQGRAPSETEFAQAPSRDRSPERSTREVPRDRSISGLLRDLSREFANLIQMEAALAKAELREKTSIFARNALAVAVGVVLAIAAAITLLWAITSAFAAFFDVMNMSPRVYAWLSPLIVAAIAMGVSYGLIKMGLNTIKRERLMPARTAQSLRQTGEWVKEKVS